ncbi:hypothetical protein ACHAWF_017413 [Thalassiosira exigua]
MTTAPIPPAPPPASAPGALTAAASAEARSFASSVASWYVHTADPYAPHARNVELRLRHPVHVVTRRILYGKNVRRDAGGVGGSDGQGGGDDLEALFNDDDAEIKDGPEALTRRTAARMEAFLASCSVALREDEEEEAAGEGEGHRRRDVGGIGEGERAGGSASSAGRNGKRGKGRGGEATKKKAPLPQLDKPPAAKRNISTASSAGKIYPQIDRGDLLFRLELYCRTLRRIRSLSDVDPTRPMEECVLRYESRRGVRNRVRVIVETYLRNVDCVRNVHRTLMTLVLRATLEVLAVECWCPELKGTVDRLASEYEHKVSFASLAFLSSPDNAAETHLAPMLTKYFEYLQMDWESLVSKCELERMLRTVLESDMRHYFKTAVFHSVGHILDECRREREILDNIALPPPWKEGVFGMVGGGETKGDVDAAMKQYCSDPVVVKQALRDLRREVITVNGQMLPPAHSHMELAEHLRQILNSTQMMLSLSSPRSQSRKKKNKKRPSNYTSDFGLELEIGSEFSGTESEGSFTGTINFGLGDVLARRLLIAASRTGAGGDAFFIVRDLFGGDEVEVVSHQSSQKSHQGTIEIIVKLSSVIIKSHAKFDIIPKPITNSSGALIQFHTTTTETIALQQYREGSTTQLREKKTDMTGWRTLAIRPAYYERIPHMH